MSQYYIILLLVISLNQCSNSKPPIHEKATVFDNFMGYRNGILA